MTPDAAAAAGPAHRAPTGRARGRRLPDPHGDELPARGSHRRPGRGHVRHHHPHPLHERGRAGLRRQRRLLRPPDRGVAGRAAAATSVPSTSSGDGEHGRTADPRSAASVRGAAAPPAPRVPQGAADRGHRHPRAARGRCGRHRDPAARTWPPRTRCRPTTARRPRCRSRRRPPPSRPATSSSTRTAPATSRSSP